MTQSSEARTSGVVVGVDGSKRNRAALVWAANAAAAHRLPLTVVFARPDATGTIQEVEEPSGVLAAAVQIVGRQCPDVTVRALQYPLAPVQSMLDVGESADFLVLGSRGVGGFRGMLVGSTTMHVAPYAHCPVVVVHDRAPAAGAASAGVRHPGMVVLGYDGSSAANRASAFAFRHAAAIGSGLVVVTVEPGRGEGEVETTTPEQAAPGSDTGAFHAPLLVTAHSFPTVPVTFVAGAGRPSEVLLAEAKGCELLVIGSRGLGGFSGLVMGSVSQKMVAYADCPVGILHEGVAAKKAAGIRS